MAQVMNRRIVYVWELPVRFFHWINAACITILVVTGLIIGNPPAIMTSQEAYYGYWFGWTRFIHFTAGYIFLFNLLIRIYWSFLGNSFANWRNFIPITPKHWAEIFSVIKSDIFLVGEHPKHGPGHNAMAYFSYFLLFILSIFQIISGMALLAPMTDWWLVDWIASLAFFMENDASYRYWHHAAMWLFILFTMIHIYLVVHHDYLDRRGILSSIIGGCKFVEDKKDGVEEN